MASGPYAVAQVMLGWCMTSDHYDCPTALKLESVAGQPVIVCPCKCHHE